MAAPPPEYLQPTPRSRLRFVLLVLLLGGAGAVLLHYAEPVFFLHLHTLPPCERGAWLRGALWALLVLPLLPALLLLGYARKLLAAGRFPLGADWLLRRTRVSRGAPVRRLAWLLLVLALGLALCSLLLLLLLLSQPLFGVPGSGCVEIVLAAAGGGA